MLVVCLFVAVVDGGVGVVVTIVVVFAVVVCFRTADISGTTRVALLDCCCFSLAVAAVAVAVVAAVAVTATSVLLLLTTNSQ